MVDLGTIVRGAAWSLAATSLTCASAAQVVEMGPVSRQTRAHLREWSKKCAKLAQEMEDGLQSIRAAERAIADTRSPAEGSGGSAGGRAAGGTPEGLREPPRRYKRNAAMCKACKTLLVSIHRHDFQSCLCGNFVDGGLDYLRRGGYPGMLLEMSEANPEYE